MEMPWPAFKTYYSPFFFPLVFFCRYQVYVYVLEKITCWLQPLYEALVNPLLKVCSEIICKVNLIHGREVHSHFRFPFSPRVGQSKVITIIEKQQIKKRKKERKRRPRISAADVEKQQPSGTPSRGNRLYHSSSSSTPPSLLLRWTQWRFALFNSTFSRSHSLLVPLFLLSLGQHIFRFIASLYKRPIFF